MIFIKGLFELVLAIDNWNEMWSARTRCETSDSENECEWLWTWRFECISYVFEMAVIKINIIPKWKFYRHHLIWVHDIEHSWNCVEYGLTHVTQGKIEELNVCIFGKLVPIPRIEYKLNCVVIAPYKHIKLHEINMQRMCVELHRWKKRQKRATHFFPIDRPMDTMIRNSIDWIDI